MMRIRGLGVTAPYVGLLIVRLLFVLLLPLMPETLPVRPLHDDASESISSPSDEGDVKRRLSRLASWRRRLHSSTLFASSYRPRLTGDGVTSSLSSPLLMRFL